jgi:ectoine hydroxylase-related dioxygenase (phytanoyl-CoA dioxygenase family)
MKHAGKPGQAWHQDEVYIQTRDRSLCGVWIALDAATRENGCLWIIPGSHKPGILWPMKPHQSDEFSLPGEVSHGWPYDGEQDAEPVEIDAGSVVFFNGYTLHCSYRNRAAHGFRRALVTHCMNARSWLPWRWDTRLPMKEDMRDIFMIAGEDPCAYRGAEDLNVPYVRPEK